MADTLCRRYLDATNMVGQADLYYLEITHTVDPASLTTWEHEVKVAEQQHSTDLKIMNIYAARILDRHGEESASASRAASAPIDQWMEHLLVVEETQ